MDKSSQDSDPIYYSCCPVAQTYLLSDKIKKL